MYWIEDGVTLAIVVSAASMVLASGLTIVFVLTRRGWRPTTSTSRDLPDLRRLVDELPVGHGDGELTCAIFHRCGHPPDCFHRCIHAKMQVQTGGAPDSPLAVSASASSP
eukprot:g31720.t1